MVNVIGEEKEKQLKGREDMIQHGTDIECKTKLKSTKTNQHTRWGAGVVEDAEKA